MRLRHPRGPTRARLNATFTHDDPTHEPSAAWGVKEHLRLLLKADTIDPAQEAKMRLGCAVVAADMPETNRLWDTLSTWWTDSWWSLDISSVIASALRRCSSAFFGRPSAGSRRRAPSGWRPTCSCSSCLALFTLRGVMRYCSIPRIHGGRVTDQKELWG